MSSDTLSFLTHSTLPLAKTWMADGTIKDYSKPKHFKLDEFTFNDIKTLSAFLTNIEKKSNTCLIRGKYTGDSPAHTMRRKEVFHDQPLHMMLVEIDKFAPDNIDPVLDPVKAIIVYIENCLPECFQNISFHWQLSNSAGHSSKAGVLKAHVYFWLTESFTSAQLKTWAQNSGYDKVLDVATLDPVQVHYTALPVFEPGATDPVPVRSGFVEGLVGDEVDLVLDADSLAARAKERPSEQTYQGDDPIALWLQESGLSKGEGPNGQILINCPFAHEHTDGRVGESDTTYLPAGTGGFNEGVFHCSHNACNQRESAEFESALGSSAVFFDPLPDDIEPSSQPKKFDVIQAGVYAERPEVTWLIKGLLPEKSLSLFFGGSGDGKTFAVLDIMLSLSRGVEWNGLRTKTGRVVYVCAEGAGGFISRLKAYSSSTGVDLKLLPFGVIPGTPNLRDFKDVKLLAEKINLFGQADVIIIDTLAQVTAGADENTGKDMGIALRHCDELRRLTNSAVSLVHHAGKDVSKGARGWSGLKAPLDAEFSVSKDGDNRKLWVEKMKDGRDGFGWDFMLETVNLQPDEDGDMRTSCVVKYTGSSMEKARKKNIIRRRGKNETLVYDSFFELGGGEVTYLDLEAKCLSHMPQTQIGKRDRRRDLVSSALTALHEKGELNLADGLVRSLL